MTKEEILRNHWVNKTNLPFDETTKHHLNYVLEAMEDYKSKELNLFFIKQQKALTRLRVKLVIFKYISRGALKSLNTSRILYSIPMVDLKGFTQIYDLVETETEASIFHKQ